ncbi:UNVERIFIED_CONTAM: hypothetical protein Slati_3370500 [Sesamum latifolium]|uniref:Uncharacterized protein n=1 Tax=Sesamum latifolium TaxID=2727402 RepID=A0AAW2UDH4_9LAMI
MARRQPRPLLVYEYGLAFARTSSRKTTYPTSTRVPPEHGHLRRQTPPRNPQASRERQAPPRPPPRVPDSVRRQPREAVFLQVPADVGSPRGVGPGPRASTELQRAVEERYGEEEQEVVAGIGMSRAPLLLTNGDHPAVIFPSSRINSFSSPFVGEFERDVVDQSKGEGDEDGDGDRDYDEYWSSAVEEIRWDTMFQNLKPT